MFIICTDSHDGKNAQSNQMRSESSKGGKCPYCNAKATLSYGFMLNLGLGTYAYCSNQICTKPTQVIFDFEADKSG